MEMPASQSRNDYGRKCSFEYLEATNVWTYCDNAIFHAWYYNQSENKPYGLIESNDGHMFYIPYNHIKFNPIFKGKPVKV